MGYSIIAVIVAVKQIQVDLVDLLRIPDSDPADRICKLRTALCTLRKKIVTCSHQAVIHHAVILISHKPWNAVVPALSHKINFRIQMD